MKKTKQFLRWHWPLFLGLMLFFSLKSQAQINCTFTTCAPFNSNELRQIYGAVMQSTNVALSGTTSANFKDNNADTLNDRLKVIKNNLFSDNGSVAGWSFKTYQSLTDVISPQLSFLQYSNDTINQNLRDIKLKIDSINYNVRNSAYGSYNNLGGYFYASTLAANCSTTNAQFGSTIPNGYRLCITSIMLSSNNTLTSFTLSLNDGNTTNVKEFFTQFRAQAGTSTNQILINYDPKVPLALTPNNSLFIASSNGGGTFNLRVMGYISKN